VASVSIWRRLLSLLGVVCAVGAAQAEPLPTAVPGDALVDVQRVAPSLRLDLRYAGPHNFTGVTLYPAPRCLLRRSVAERLQRVQRRLHDEGFGLLLWDCYRPFSVQERLWALVPDARYVAEPQRRAGVPASGSKHNRGAAVDVTLVDAHGRQLAMPTDFDDFSQRAHRDAAGIAPAARANAERLQAAMLAEGFTPLPTEWWHFDAPDWQRYDLSDVPLNGD
jgi:beta-N-acetylhexosaminidase/D-alanyl-D-alanine dipeptidase